MYAVYCMNMNDLDDRFVEALRALFKDKEVEITVTEIDETQDLLQGEANRIRLLQAVRNIENGQNLVIWPHGQAQNCSGDGGVFGSDGVCW